jgi:acyl-CoA thioester hydrolase
MTAREEFPFIHRLRVRWHETDLQGIVFFANYLAYFDIAMTEYFRELGFPYPEGLVEHGADLFIVKTSAEYHGSARFDDVLDVCVRPGRIGRSSLPLLFEIHRGEELLVSGEMIYVNAEPESRQNRPLPESLKAALQQPG